MVPHKAFNSLAGNNRIYFNGHRALEGTTDGSTLQIGEGYSTIKIQDTTLIKYLTSTDSSTFLTLHNDVGADLGTQKTFIDFIFEDDNDNDWPQVRIGAEVGQNSNADSQLKEGSGAFVVYTNNASTNSPGNPSNLAERFRVDYQGHTTATGSLKAPIFYDSGNTGYFLNPNNISELRHLKLKAAGDLDIYVSDNDAWVHSDARDEGSVAALYKYTRSASTGYGYYKEYWYDGNSYQSIRCYNDTFQFSGPVSITDGNLEINALDGGGAPAMTSQFTMKGYEGRGIGIKMKDNVHSANNSDDREWFIGSGYNTSAFNIGYSASGSQSSYPAQSKLIVSTGGDVTGVTSLRSPIFYDSNNTSYYTYPSSQSVFYRLKLQGTGLAGAATLEIDNPSTSSFIHTGELLTANMTAGQANIFVIGKEGSTKNSGYIGYNYASAGSNNNYVTIGHWGADHLFRVYGDVITSSLSIRSSSDVRGTIFYDSNDTAYYVDPFSTSRVNIVNHGTLTWQSGSNNPTAKINVEVNNGAAINIYNTEEDKAYLRWIDSQSNGSQFCHLSFDSSSNYFTINNMGNDTMFITNAGYSKLTNNGNTTWNGYSFHSITNSAANEPTVMVYSHASTGNVYGINVIHRSTSANTSGRFFSGETNSGNNSRIKIYSNGNIQNSNNSYGQLSDINLKENIVDATPKLDEINQVRVVNFNYIDDINEETNAPTKQIGVVAQELEEIFPGLVYECGDTEVPTKSVKYSVFVPILIKAMQELTQEVKTLKDQINGIN